MKYDRRRTERALFVGRQSESTAELFSALRFKDFYLEVQFVNSTKDLINISLQIENSLLFLDMCPESINILIKLRNAEAIAKLPVIAFAPYKSEAFTRIAEELGFYSVVVRTGDLKKDAKELSHIIAINYEYSLCSEYPYVRGHVVSKYYWHDPATEILDYPKAISDFLERLGVRKELAGHKYLVMAICIQKTLYSEPPVPKHLYRLAADHYGTTPRAVEKAIRYAIESAWTNGDYYLQNSMFGLTVDESRGKPTNAEFIARLGLEFYFRH